MGVPCEWEKNDSSLDLNVISLPNPRVDENGLADTNNLLCCSSSNSDLSFSLIKALAFVFDVCPSNQLPPTLCLAIFGSLCIFPLFSQISIVISEAPTFNSHAMKDFPFTIFIGSLLDCEYKYNQCQVAASFWFFTLILVLVLFYAFIIIHTTVVQNWCKSKSSATPAWLQNLFLKI